MCWSPRGPHRGSLPDGDGINVVALDAVTIAHPGNAEVIPVGRARANPLHPQGVIGNDITVLALHGTAQQAPADIVTSPDLDGAIEATPVGFESSTKFATKG